MFEFDKSLFADGKREKTPDPFLHRSRLTPRSVPHEFEPLLLAEHRALYNLLFASASGALLEMAADVLEPAVVMVPHSWSVSRQHSPGRLHSVGRSRFFESEPSLRGGSTTGPNRRGIADYMDFLALPYVQRGQAKCSAVQCVSWPVRETPPIRSVATKHHLVRFMSLDPPGAERRGVVATTLRQKSLMGAGTFHAPYDRHLAAVTFPRAG
jgi:hypothetical protein